MTNHGMFGYKTPEQWSIKLENLLKLTYPIKFRDFQHVIQILDLSNYYASGH